MERLFSDCLRLLSTALCDQKDFVKLLSNVYKDMETGERKCDQLIIALNRTN